jgi:hypothetical protein
MKNPLSIISPQLAAQWHPTKNGGLTPEQVSAGSKTKVWWKCSNGPDHEWPASIEKRVKRRDGCPCCAGQKVSVTNSLASISPEIAQQWHPTENGSLTPEQVVAGSPKKAWWKCPKGPDHEWPASIGSRAGENGRGCPFCAGIRVSVTNSLASLYPELAQQWHPTKNGSLTPEQVVAGSGKKAWWKCPTGPDHEWEAVIDRRARGNGCPCCRGLQASITNSLASISPELTQQWHPTKNGKLTPAEVVAGSNKKAWWKCSNGSDHEWEAVIDNRVRGNGCPCCRGLQSSITNSLTSLYPEIAKQWHPTKNGKLPPDQVVAGSTKKAWWICPEGADHEWEAVIDNRVRGKGCPYCAGQKVSVTNCLATRYPEIAKQWHPTKNGTLTPSAVVAGTQQKVWWQCTQDSKHEWDARISNRVHGRGCPVCNKGWTVTAIRGFVASLINYLGTFTPAELYLIFQQSGLLQIYGKSKIFVKALATGRFPKEEIEKFVNGEPSIVDQFLQDKDLTLEALEINNNIPEVQNTTSEEQIKETIEPSQEEDNLNLPIIQTREVLASLDHNVVSSADEEAVEFLMASAKAKIWKHVFHDETTAIAQAEEYTGDTYADRVKTEFLDEYHRAKTLEIPTGYAFRIGSELAEPNLMQRLIAVRVRDRKRVGNWSGTGAGKTLSAVLASRIINANLTLICCPNSVVEGWKNAIVKIFPDSLVITKNFNPNWANAIGDETGLGAVFNPETYRYLIVNYEMFQQPNSPDLIRSFLEKEFINFIVIDEIHYTKQRQVQDMSRRKELVTALITTTAERNPNLHVIGMSATPVINNIQEGKSLIEMVTGVAHNELDIRPTIDNCMRLHQRLVTLGIRWMPEYNIDYEQIEIPVDCGDYIEEIHALGGNGTPLQLEKILTVARLPVIRQHIQPKTLIYTHYIQGIDRILRDALVNDGWKVGFYTGEDKSGLEGFLNGKIDVLIGSSAIGTGVDGLQHVCNQLIVNVLPWTHAEFEQLKGRIYRQGQTRDTVKMVIPLTYATVNSQRWSWCDSKMQRLKFKKSIADAAVDGIVPEGHLRSSAQAYQDTIDWLKRLASGEVQIITRPKIIIPIPDTNPAEVQQRLARYGDFSTMNRHWNQTQSSTTHQRLQENPEEWAQYHTLYQNSRKDWAVIPYEEMIRWCQQRSGYTIGDFGCGEAKLAEAVSDRHTVYSFDHIAINNNVISCDMAHLPLDDETLDVAIFSLALMGSNFTDYLREAHRTLKLDGQLHIIESTSRFSDRGQLGTEIETLGFTVITIQDMWKFTHIRAIKS